MEKHIHHGGEERRARARERYELEEAVKVQQRLLPAEFPQVSGIEIAGGCRPAGAMAGDYFDVFQLGSKIGLCIADVIGKGLPAALMMSNLQAAVKVTAAERTSPSELCERVNKLACRNGSVDKFISFFYATYDPVHHTLVYCNAGHNPPIVLRRGGKEIRLESSDIVLGQRPDWAFHDAEILLAPGDRLVLYTDGITEAGVHKGDEFGEERMIASLKQSPEGSADASMRALMTDVTRHCADRFDDDATCVILSVAQEKGSCQSPVSSSRFSVPSSQ